VDPADNIRAHPSPPRAAGQRQCRRSRNYLFRSALCGIMPFLLTQEQIRHNP
jgi:hypothetical protein